MLNRRSFVSATLVVAAGSALGTRQGFTQSLSKEEVFFDKDAPVLGNPKGDVTVVEFFDYQCPYCKSSHPDVMDVVNTDGNVRLLMKDWPIFGEPSIFAAQAVLGAAKMGKYAVAFEALMKTKGKLSHEQIKEELTKAGLSMQKIAEQVNKSNEQISALLDRNYGQALAFNFAGTPAFVIGTALYPGVLRKADLRKAIARARAA